jgi:hypothetical protein
MVLLVRVWQLINNRIYRRKSWTPFPHMCILTGSTDEQRLKILVKEI